MGNGSMVVVIGICVYAVFIFGLGLLKKTDGKNFVNVGGGIGSFALVCSMFISIILVVFIVPYAALQMVAIGNGIALGTKGIISFELAVVTPVHLLCDAASGAVRCGVGHPGESGALRCSQPDDHGTSEDRGHLHYPCGKTLLCR